MYIPTTQLSKLIKQAKVFIEEMNFMAFMDEMEELALNKNLSPSNFLYRLEQLREKYGAGKGKTMVVKESAYSTCKREDIPIEHPKVETPKIPTECVKLQESDIPIGLSETKVIEPITVVTNNVIKKEKSMKKIKAINPPISFVREQMEMAGSNFGSVRFIKRTDGTERRMSYKLHVANPKYVKAPKENEYFGRKTYQTKDGTVQVLTFDKHKTTLENNHLLTVFDVNLPIRDKEGKVTGKRGGYRSVPLDSVTRICTAGNILEIEWT